MKKEIRRESNHSWLVVWENDAAAGYAVRMITENRIPGLLPCSSRNLDDRLQLARKALMTRIARLEGVKARVAPILYMEGACGVRLKADDDVSEIFKNGRASISLGYIGIHETVNALFDNQHVYDSEALREKADRKSVV